jgi:DNA-binding MarR family transcriptional regulator
MKRLRQGGFLIARIHQIVERVFDQAMRERGLAELSPPQTRILYTMWHGDGIPIFELSRRTSLSKSTLTAMLDRLEAMGFVRRARSLKDRRAILIHTTAKEKAVRRRYAAASKDMAEIFYRDFAAHEIERFERYLTRILQNLEDAENS